jgi:two-component system chemotaxis response regulator CheY
MPKRVLIIDDSLFMRKQLTDLLTGAGYEVIGEAGTGEKGIEMAEDLKPDIITLDNVLPDMNGIDVLQAVKKIIPNTRIVMVSAVAQQSVITEEINLGAHDYITKPISPDKLLATLSK